jgi:hypothetical protein
MRMRIGLVAAAGLLCIGVAGSARADWGWLVDITPGTVLANFEANDFDITGTDRGITEQEEMSLASTIPSVSAGVRYERPSGYIDLKAGGGMLLNARLRAYMLQGVVGGLVEVKQSMMIGPEVGVAYFADPEWWGDADVDLDPALGFLVGFRILMGDRVSYVLAFDYYSFTFDVDRVGAGWTPSDTEIDMSGPAVQFGLRLQF